MTREREGKNLSHYTPCGIFDVPPLRNHENQLAFNQKPIFLSIGEKKRGLLKVMVYRGDSASAERPDFRPVERSRECA